MDARELGRQRIRLFASERLEMLTLVSARMFALIWTLSLILLIWVGWEAVSVGKGLGLVLSGLFTWTLFEYSLHRHLFHLRTKQPVLNWLLFLMHGNHHDNPNDPLRGLMPFAVSLPMGLLIWSGLLMLFGAPGTWLFLGFALGYVAYDGLHYACHQRPMRGKVAMALKRHHMRHHYVDERGNYAISAIFWDHIFGTAVRSSKRQ